MSTYFVYYRCEGWNMKIIKFTRILTLNDKLDITIYVENKEICFEL